MQPQQNIHIAENTHNYSHRQNNTRYTKFIQQETNKQLTTVFTTENFFYRIKSVKFGNILTVIKEKKLAFTIT